MGITLTWFSVLKILLAVCIFINSSVSSVESYRCVNKMCFNGRCNSNSNTCESSKGCFSERQDFEMSSQKPRIKIEKKGCPKDACTELAFSATLGSNQVFRYAHQCCYTQQCNKEPIELPPSSSRPNGVVCFSCYTDNNNCNPVLLKCTGEETKCVSFTGIDMRDDGFYPIRGMGCGTETVCNLSMTVLETARISASCVSGSPPLRFASSLLSGLFLINALL